MGRALISDLDEASANMWRMQKQFDCYPDCYVTVNGSGIPMTKGLDSKTENQLHCTLDSDLLQRILNREEHWNNAELGCHIMFDRKGPYMPDVHTLMCFFHKAAT